RRRHTRFSRDWSSDVCSSDLNPRPPACHPAELPDEGWGKAAPAARWSLRQTAIGEREPPAARPAAGSAATKKATRGWPLSNAARSEEHTSELQSRENLVCRLL